MKQKNGPVLLSRSIYRYYLQWQVRLMGYITIKQLKWLRETGDLQN